jgi:hypothetical protein
LSSEGHCCEELTARCRAGTTAAIQPEHAWCNSLDDGSRIADVGRRCRRTRWCHAGGGHVGGGHGRVIGHVGGGHVGGGNRVVGHVGGGHFVGGNSRIVHATNGYYGRGVYHNHSYYLSTHGWRYGHGYRWGYHRFWRSGVWVWDYGYYYDPHYVGALYYFDDGYVPDDVAPQPEYVPNDQPAQPQPEQPQPEQAQPEQPQPEQPYGESDSDDYEDGAGAPGNTPPTR